MVTARRADSRSRSPSSPPENAQPGVTTEVGIRWATPAISKRVSPALYAVASRVIRSRIALKRSSGFTTLSSACIPLGPKELVALVHGLGADDDRDAEHLHIHASKQRSLTAIDTRL